MRLCEACKHMCAKSCIAGCEAFIGLLWLSAFVVSATCDTCQAGMLVQVHGRQYKACS
jgi:hypothetical protein